MTFVLFRFVFYVQKSVQSGAGNHAAAAGASPVDDDVPTEERKRAPGNSDERGDESAPAAKKNT